jgi:hypothetical protein
MNVRMDVSSVVDPDLVMDPNLYWSAGSGSALGSRKANMTGKNSKSEEGIYV